MTNPNPKKEGAYAQLTGFRRSIPIILVALAVFTALCFIMQDTGALGQAISSVLLGLFSIGGYFIPAFLAIHAIFYASDYKKKRTVTRIIFTCITIFTIAALTHTIANFGEKITFNAAELYKNGTKNKGGGFIGGLISFLLTRLFGTVGVIIIAVLVFALYVTYFLAGGKSVFSKLLLKILTAISNLFASLDQKRKTGKQKQQKRRELRRRAALAEEQELLTDDEFFAADNGMRELTISELGIKEVRDDKELERNPYLQDKVFHKSESKPEKSYGTHSEEERSYGYEEPKQRRQVNMDYSTTNSSHGLSVSVDDSSYHPKHDDIIYESHTEQSAFGDANAEDLFGKDFEPFDFKINEELSNKPSSKASKATAEPEGISEITESLNDVSEEDIEKARQRADFEMKKRAALEAQKRYAEAQAEIARRSEENQAMQKAAYNTEAFDIQSEPSIESEPYIPDYMKSSEPEVQPYVPKAEPDKRAESFASAINDYEMERQRSDFKPYTPPSANIFVSDTSQNEEKREPEQLIVTRTMLDPSPTSVQTSTPPQESNVFTEDNATKMDFSFATDDADEDEEVFDFTNTAPEDDSEDITEEISPAEQNPDVIEQRRLFPFLDTEDSKSDEEDEDVSNVSAFDSFANSNDIEEPEAESEDTPPFEYEAPRKTLPFDKPKPTPTPPPAPQKEEKPDYSDYQFPPLDLLIKGKAEEDLNQEEEKNQNAEKLVDALLQFNVRISIKGIDRGPRITRYEIVPARGVKVNSVTNLFNDIALNLGVEGMRMEAPIPGKSAIGVEIPNKKPSTVLLRDLVESDEFICASSKTMSCLGKDVTGNPVFADIAKMPHVLIAGATGMGKSVCINSILISILYKARPDEVKFIMIDPKKVEFNGYNGIPHLLVPVVTDVKQAAGALMWAVEQMEKRYDLMEALEVRKLDSYNEKVRENPELGEPLPKIVIVIDELNDIMLQVRKPAEDLIMSIAQKARAAGIHLIIGTQRPSVDVITGVIKANIPSRISCKVASYNDSKTILEQAGAEKLLNNGDMLYISAGAPKALRVQGAFVSDGEVAAIMKFLKSQAKGNIYDSQALEEINRAAQKCSKGKGGDDYGDDDDDDGDNVGVLNDQQFLDAVELAVKSGKISTSLIQRKISIGYGKAAKFIDIMEDMGIVSEPNGQKPRDVLITRDEWHEMLSRRSLD